MIKQFCTTLANDEDTQPLSKRIFDGICISVIVFDLILLPLETTEYFSIHFAEPVFLHRFIIFLFTIEYLIRIIGSDNKIRFITSFYGLIDLLAIVPFVFTLGITDTSYIRIFRLLRLFRILKLTRYSTAVKRLTQAMVEIKRELFTILTIGLFVVYIFSALIYSVEHPAQPEKVANMFDAFWLTFVTITTLGYGDITPITHLGRLLTILFMVFSIGVLIIPSSVLTVHLMEKRKEEQEESSHTGTK